MNKLFVPAVLGVLTLACAPLLAQEKNVPSAAPTGAYRFVSNNEVLTNGDVVTITRKGGAPKISGVFVYADPKTGRLFIRPRPGQAPVAVASNDVDKIDRITPAIGRADKDGVRFANQTDAKRAPTYEIHELRGYNGPYTSVFFYDAAVSPGEHEQLMTIEKASAEVVRKGLRVDALRQAIQEAITELTAPLVPIVFPVYVASDAFLFPYPVAISPTPATAYALGSPPIVPASMVENQGAGKDTLAILTNRLTEAEVALKAARNHYDDARRRAVYEPGGSIVAVRLGD